MANTPCPSTLAIVQVQQKSKPRHASTQTEQQPEYSPLSTDQQYRGATITTRLLLQQQQVLERHRQLLLQAVQQTEQLQADWLQLQSAGRSLPQEDAAERHHTMAATERSAESTPVREQQQQKINGTTPTVAVAEQEEWWDAARTPAESTPVREQQQHGTAPTAVAEQEECWDATRTPAESTLVREQQQNGTAPTVAVAEQEECSPPPSPSTQSLLGKSRPDRPTTAAFHCTAAATADSMVSPLGDGTAKRRPPVTQARHDAATVVRPLQLVFTRVVVDKSSSSAAAEVAAHQQHTVTASSQQQKTRGPSVSSFSSSSAVHLDAASASQSSSQTVTLESVQRRRSKFSKETPPPAVAQPTTTSSSEAPVVCGNSGWISNAPARAFIDGAFVQHPGKKNKGINNATTATNKQRITSTAAAHHTYPHNSTTADAFAYKGDRQQVRCASARHGLVCHDCYQCQRFFAVMARAGHGDDDDADDAAILQPRHRSVCLPNDTPDDFWDLDFADEKE